MTLSRIERLDLVARSRASFQTISYARIVLLILTPLFVFLAVNSTASSRETALVATLAVASLLTALLLWLDWRFKLYALSLFCFLFAVCDVVSNDHSHSHRLLGFVGANALVLLFVYYGCGLWLMGRRYALASHSSFREEREQLDRWMDALNGASPIEFPSGSFWTGYWTYRILNPEGCWLVAQFKRGGTRLRSCRVYELGDVSFTRLPSGRWQVEIGHKGEKTKSFIEVEVSSGSPSVLRMT
jgi:hypothetical protein